MKRNLNSVCFSWSVFLQAGIVFDVFQTPTLFRRFQRLFFAAVRPALLVCPSYWQEGGGKDQVKRQIYCPENVPTARLTGKTIVQKTKTKILVIEMKFIIIIIFLLNNLHHHHTLTQICVAVQCHEGNWTSLVALMALLAEETPSSSNPCQHQHQYFLSYHMYHHHDHH